MNINILLTGIYNQSKCELNLHNIINIILTGTHYNQANVN